MAPYLAELTAREFTRDVQLDDPPHIICLRFAEDLDPALAAGAVQRALAALQQGRPPNAGASGGHRWQLYHIAPPRPRRPLYLRPRQAEPRLRPGGGERLHGARRDQMKLVLYGAGGPVAPPPSRSWSSTTPCA